MRIRWLALIVLCGFMLPLSAQDVPPALRDWQEWVLHDTPQHRCPFLTNQGPAGNAQCVWSSRLNIDADEQGGHFSFGVHVDAPGWVVLPGDDRHWPQAVTVNGQTQPVLRRNDQPALWLTPGDYALRGVFPWTQRPAQLRVPESIGLITLHVDGKPVSRIERNGERITLGEAAPTQRAIDALSIRVYRRLEDGLPATLETRLQFDVTGSAREQLLGPALPSEFIATSLSGTLPARLENDGRLRVQLRPGQWTIILKARAAEMTAQIDLPAASEPWPGQEIWSYADVPQWRGTRASGAATDAAQAGVPDEWRNLPAFVLDRESGLSIEPGLRGVENGSNDQLQLTREIWLDFDGRGFTVADRLNGRLRLPQRLDVMGPWQLQRATQNGQSLLITRDAQGRDGIEVRDRQLNLQAGLRLPDHTGALPSAGWKLPLERIDANLHLPYGYRLLGARGVDQSPDSWVSQWSLLDLFVVALISLLAGRLLGWRWALLTAATFALSQHEPGAPRWTIAAALALALLMRALPEGRLRLSARIGAMAMLSIAVLWTLPFAAQQMHYALHPQLQGGGTPLSGVNPIAMSYHNAAAPPPAAEPAAGAMEETADRDELRQHPAALATVTAPPASAAADHKDDATAYGGLRSSASKPMQQMRRQQRVDQLTDSRTIMQAGVGIPHWEIRDNNYRLIWSSPVSAEQTTRLFIVPAWLVRLLRVAMLALLVTLLARMAIGLGAPLQRLVTKSGRAAAAAGILLTAGLSLSAHAQNTPSPDLLEQLRKRLLEAPECAPACAALPSAQVRADADAIHVELEAHVGAAVAMPLPQSDDTVPLLGVAVDGRADAALVRRGNGLWLRMERGVHRVTLRYDAAGIDSANLRFVLPPRHVTFHGRGWTAGGLNEDHLLGDNLALSRERDAGQGEAVSPVQSFPPYVRLVRRLVLGLDWSVENTVERIAPESDGFTVSLPLLSGEHPLGDDAQVRDGRIAITLTSDQPLASWTSRLDRVDELKISAPPLGEHAEVWEVSAAPIWHVDAQGLPPSDSEEGLRFQPLPGETLQLNFSQPVATEGASIAFDRVRVESSAGERVSDTTLTLRARSTRGGEHAIKLPEGVELLSAARDDVPLNLAVRDGMLSLPLLPGEHTFVLRLREPHGVGLRTLTPTFDLRAPAANIELNQQLPRNRWVLWTWGPTAGPAVLYWSQIVVLLIASWLLARHAPTPLRFRHWLLLGLGFSAFSWMAYCLVAGWLIAFGLRSRFVPFANRGPVLFDLLQVLLGLLTLLALGILIAAVPSGLLGMPDMHVRGMNSSAWDLNWIADQTDAGLPRGGAFSVSLWIYKIAMLAWALWLANALIGWLRWAFKAWSNGGYWRRVELPAKTRGKPPQLPDEPDGPDGTETKSPPP